MLQCLLKYQNQMLKAFYQRPDLALILNLVKFFFFARWAIISGRVLKSACRTDSMDFWHIGIGTNHRANMGFSVEYMKGNGQRLKA